MDKMDLQSIDFRGELRETIHRFFSLPPVVIGNPISYKFLEVGEIRTVVPTGPAHFIRPSRSTKSVAQVIENGLRDGDGKGGGVQEEVTSYRLRVTGFELFRNAD